MTNYAKYRKRGDIEMWKAFVISEFETYHNKDYDQFAKLTKVSISKLKKILDFEDPYFKKSCAKKIERVFEIHYQKGLNAYRDLSVQQLKDRQDSHDKMMRDAIIGLRKTRIEMDEKDKLRKLEYMTIHVNDPVDDLVIPDVVIHLTFGDTFNQSIDGLTLPDSLETLAFGASFNQSIDELILPETLEYVKFGEAFTQSLRRFKTSHQLRCIFIPLGWPGTLKSLRKLNCKGFEIMNSCCESADVF